MRSRTYTITSWWAQTTSQISIPLNYHRRNHHPRSKQPPSTKTPTSTRQLMLQFLPVFLLITFEPHGSHRSHAQRPHRWHHWNIGLPGVHRRHRHQSPGRGRHGSARGQGALRSRADARCGVRGSGHGNFFLGSTGTGRNQQPTG